MRRATMVLLGGVSLLLGGCGLVAEEGGLEVTGPVGSVTIAGCNPQNPLIPVNTTETCGGHLLGAMFSMLVRYDVEDAEVENEIASSITSDDNQVWTIELNDGWTFHDGTPITARSFVDAWNFAANSDNAEYSTSSYFFSPIEGFAAAQSDGEDLSGLRVINDLAFEVTLSQPEAGFPGRLGYTAFAPMPEILFTDIEAYIDSPVGSGPFELVSFVQGDRVEFRAYDDYAGDLTPQIENLTFRMYESNDAAYADLLADNLDVMTQLPPMALTGEAYKSDLGDRYVERETGVLHWINFSPSDETLDADLRKAVSMSIDRQLIIDNIFQGAMAPASGWVSPVVDGYLPGQCGEYCTYNVDSARAHLAASDFEGDLVLSFNLDGSHVAWTQAVCNSIKNALEIDCNPNGIALFSEFLEIADGRDFDGMFRGGWQMDYPSIESFLGPLYVTGVESNYGDYENSAFDDLIRRAASAEDEEALALYQEAELLLAEDMAVVPLWYGKAVAGWSSNVDNVHLTVFQTVDLFSVTTR